MNTYQFHTDELVYVHWGCKQTNSHLARFKEYISESEHEEQHCIVVTVEYNKEYTVPVSIVTKDLPRREGRKRTKTRFYLNE